MAGAHDHDHDDVGGDGHQGTSHGHNHGLGYGLGGKGDGLVAAAVMTHAMIETEAAGEACGAEDCRAEELH